MTFLQNLPDIVSVNDLDMRLFTQMLRTLLQSYTDQLLAQVTYVSYVEQSAEPNQSQWEAQWLFDGHTLPIPATAILIWKNTSTNVIGGIYGTTPISSTVVRRESQYPRGGSLWWAASASSAQSTSAAINVGNANHPSVQITLPTTCDVIMEFMTHTVLSSGTGTWGADFLLDGAKVGTTYYSLPANVGLINISSTGPLYVKAMIQNVPAGVYTVQAIMGVTGSPASPPTIAYGGIGAGAGQYGLRELFVRAVIK